MDRCPHESNTQDVCWLPYPHICMVTNDITTVYHQKNIILGSSHIQSTVALTVWSPLVHRSGITRMYVRLRHGISRPHSISFYDGWEMYIRIQLRMLIFWLLECITDIKHESYLFLSSLVCTSGSGTLSMIAESYTDNIHYIEQNGGNQEY